MPNLFAIVIMFAWPFIAYGLFIGLRANPARAVSWVVLASLLILPSKIGINVPVLPPLDKFAICGLTLGAITLLHRPIGSERLRLGYVSLIFLAFAALGPLGTALTNGDTLYHNFNVRRGLTLYDGASFAVRQFFTITLPFIAGYCFLKKAEDFKHLLFAIFIAGLLYSVLMLYEVRFSPQLNRTVYGYFPHFWLQQIRSGGFRPVVFLQHGLWVAFFAMMFTVSAFALWRNSLKDQHVDGLLSRNYLPIAIYFFVVLVFCRSLASLAYSLFLIPVVTLLSPKQQVYVAVALATFAILYPLLRTLELVPLDAILGLANSIDPERANSLAYRLTNDQRLMERALERPLFGWGGWARGLIYVHQWTDRTIIVDGFWVGILGKSGLVGFLSVFGLLGWPLFRFASQVIKKAVVPTAAVSACCLLVAINMIELLPNSTLLQTSWLIVGGLLALAQQPQVDKIDAVSSKRLAERTRRRTVL